ncbi:MAG TPA: hypothetical protein VGN76_14905 [Gemmatimonadales bacterium]|jgi:hypothetical protein|nr:hypothetical protein [Gemmatimonadales bacterium]
MGRTRALIGLVVALACTTRAQGQVSGSDSTSRVNLFFPRDSTATTLLRPQIAPPSYDSLTAASAVQPSVHTEPPSLDVADRVVTVWLVKYR